MISTSVVVTLEHVSDASRVSLSIFMTCEKSYILFHDFHVRCRRAPHPTPYSPLSIASRVRGECFAPLSSAQEECPKYPGEWVYLATCKVSLRYIHLVKSYGPKTQEHSLCEHFLRCLGLQRRPEQMYGKPTFEWCEALSSHPGSNT